MLRSAYYPVEYITHETKIQPTTSKNSLDHNEWVDGLSPPISSIGPLNETFSSNASLEENAYESAVSLKCVVPKSLRTTPAPLLFVPQWSEAVTSEIYPSDLAAEPAAAESQTALPTFVPRWDSFTSDDTSVDMMEEEDSTPQIVGKDATLLIECEDSILVHKENDDICDNALGKEHRTPSPSLFCDAGSWVDFTLSKGKSWVDFMPSWPFFK